jgi:hypothetical protein
LVLVMIRYVTNPTTINNPMLKNIMAFLLISLDIYLPYKRIHKIKLIALRCCKNIDIKAPTKEALSQ